MNESMIQIRLPQALKKRLEEVSTRKGLSTSAFVRMVVLDRLSGETSQDWARDDAVGGRR